MTDLPPSPSSPLEAPPAPGPSRGARLAIAGVALAVVVALVAGVVVVTSGDDGGGDDDTTTTTDRATTTEPPAEEDPAALEEAVAELSRFVEQHRGRPFLRPVEVELLADDEFVERLRSQEEDDEEEVAETERLFRAIGLLEPDDDLQAAIDQVIEAGVVGFYDPETDALVVRGSDVSASVRSTLVHELTHAWDDQHFELHRPQLDDADDESGFGFSALVEGDANRVEQVWLSQLGAEERNEVAESQGEAPEGLDDIPDVVLQLISLPYETGPPLVAALVAAGGEARVDAAFETPPTTSEHVLEPATFVNAAQPAVAVPDPAADGEVEDQGVFGTAGVFITLSDGISLEDARAAAAGWGGDRYVTWADGERGCMRLAVVGDTPADTDELRSAWTAWAEEQDDATAEDVDGRVVVTSCA